MSDKINRRSVRSSKQQANVLTTIVPRHIEGQYNFEDDTVTTIEHDYFGSIYKNSILDESNTCDVLLWPANDTSFTNTEFYWSLNNSYESNFGWDGRKWSPYKGTNPVNLGKLSTDTLKIPVDIPEYPEGHLVSDPIFWQDTIGNLVSFRCVAKQNDALLYDNDVFYVVETKNLYFPRPNMFLGHTFYMSPPYFSSKYDGKLTNDFNAKIYLSPIPKTFECPLLRIGFRDYLNVIVISQSVQMPSLAVGEAYVIKETGEVILSSDDLNSLKMDSSSYDSANFNNYLFYDGISKAPPMPSFKSEDVSLIDDVLYVPTAVFQNFSEISNLSGVPISGIWEVLDGSGVMPNISLSPDFRVGGASFDSEPSGRVSKLPQSVIIVNFDNVISNIKTYKYDPEISSFELAKGEAYLVLNKEEHGYKLVLSYLDYASGDSVKIKNLYVSPAYKFDNATLVSYKTFSADVEDGDRFKFWLDNDQYTFTTSLNGSVSFYDLAEEFNSWAEDAEVDVFMSVEFGFIYLKSESKSVKISYDGLNTLAQKLGFTPGWRSHLSFGHWNSTLGFCFEFHPENFVVKTLFEGQISENILDFNYQFLQHIPQQDQIGYDNNIFFKIDNEELVPLEDVVYKFDQNKIIWVAQSEIEVEYVDPTNIISLKAQGVIENSYKSPIGYAQVANNTSLYEDVDLELNLTSGNGLLLDILNIPYSSGFSGNIEDNIFSDSINSLSEAVVGDFIKVGTKFYKIIDVGPITLDGEIDDQTNVSWEIFNVNLKNEVTPYVYEEFSHLKTDPFELYHFLDIDTEVELNKYVNKDLFYLLTLDDVPNPVVKLQNKFLGYTSDTIVLENDAYINDCHIRIGSEVFIPSYVDVITGVGVEILNSTLDVHISDAIKDEVGLEKVYQIQKPLSGQVSFDPNSLTFYPTDTQAKFVGYKLQNSVDYLLDVIGGAVTLTDPLLENAYIIARYYKADSQGKKLGSIIQEVIPFLISKELAQRESNFRYRFNSDDKPLSNLNISVYQGTTLKNFGANKDYFIEGNVVVFNKPLNLDEKVYVYYSVLSSVSGVRNLKTSITPIYRPPFYIPKGFNTFGLRGDRVQSFVENELLKINNANLYVTNVEYLPASDVTKITFYPPTKEEIGSRTPSSPTSLLKTGVAIETSDSNLWIEVSDSIDPITKMSNTIKIQGNYTFINSGHVLDLNGAPHSISQVSFENNTTTLTLASVIYDDITNPVLKISRKPIYQVGDSLISAYGAIYNFDSHYLVKFDNTKTGEVLNENVDYNINYASGLITLKEGLNANESLYLFASFVNTIKPYTQDGLIINPKFRAKFQYETIPSNKGITGKLYGKYYYYNPDTYTVKLETVESSFNFYNQTLYGGSSELLYGFVLDADSDNKSFNRALQIKLSEFHKITDSWDAFVEAYHGYFIGGFDGKFKYFLGEDPIYPIKGYDDPYNMSYVAENLYDNLCSSYGKYLYFDVGGDSIIDPSLDNFIYESGNIISDMPSSLAYSKIFKDQKNFRQNDLFDIYLDKSGTPLRYTSDVSPYIRNQDLGSFKSAAESKFSRFFPVTGKFRFMSYPGPYTYGRNVDGVWVSTYLQEIGSLHDPILSSKIAIDNALVYKAVPSFYIWQLNLEDELSFVATIKESSQYLQIHDDLIPSTDIFISEGGDEEDLNTGSSVFGIPALNVGQVLGIRRGDSVFNIIERQIGGVEKEVSVRAIDYGCFVLLKNSDDDPILKVDNLYVNNTPILEFIKKGDLLEGIVSLVSPEIETYRLGYDYQVTKEGSILDLSLPSEDDGALVDLQVQYNQNPLTPEELYYADVNFTYVFANPVEFKNLDGSELDLGSHRTLKGAEILAEKELLAQAQHNLSYLFASYDDNWIYPNEFQVNDAIVADSNLVSFGTLSNLEAGALHVRVDVLPKSNESTEPGIEDLREFDIMLFQHNESTYSGIYQISKIERIEMDPDVYGARIYAPRYITHTSQGRPISYTLDNAVVYLNESYPLNPQSDPPSGVRLIEIDLDNDGFLDTTILDFSDVEIYFNDGVTAGSGSWNDLWYFDSSDDRYYNVITLKAYARTDSNITDTPGSNPYPNAGDVLFTITISQGVATFIDYSGTNIYNVNLIDANAFTSGVTYTGNIVPVTSNRQFVFTLAGLLDLNATGNINEWYIPYSESNSGNPGWIKESLYGFEFSISVDTYASDGLNKGKSNNAYVQNDRLTFSENLDFTLARSRGFTHPLKEATELSTKLVIYNISTPDGDSFVNSYVNGLSQEPLEYDSFYGVPNGLIGNPVKEDLRAPSLVEYGHNYIPTDEITCSLIPSTEYQAGGIICNGIATTDVGLSGYNYRIKEISVLDGSLENIQKGDLLIIDGSDDPSNIAAETVGSYLVRYNLISEPMSTYRTINLDGLTGSKHSWVGQVFPKCLEFDLGAASCLVDIDIDNFGNSGRVYFILSAQGLLDSTSFAESLVSADYSSKSGRYFLGLSNWRWASGSIVTSGQLENLSLANKLVSGMSYLEINLKGQADLPDDKSIVADTGFKLGFTGVEILYNNTASFDNSTILENNSSPGVDQISIVEAIAEDSTSFLADSDSIVYGDVPAKLYLTGISDALWGGIGGINLPSGSSATNYVSCILPHTQITGEFKALGGCFIEPSWPRSAVDLALGPHVVDRDHSYSHVGLRKSNEAVHFSIRRTRRFSNIGKDFSDTLTKLRRLYEIRRGRISDYTLDIKLHTIIEASEFEMTWNQDNSSSAYAGEIWNCGGVYSGTNLGSFSEVGVSYGDIFRLLGPNGDVIASRRIIYVDGDNLTLESPELEDVSQGDRFEIFIQNGQVPLEQALKQLYENLGVEILVSRPNFLESLGGYVQPPLVEESYSDAINKLRDTEISDWTQTDVTSGDYLIIDPQGKNSISDERGALPQGDVSEISRPNYAPGRPSELDDNRGFYKVVTVEKDYLEVDPTISLVEENRATTFKFNLLPTVHDSLISDNSQEGYNDLRPTQYLDNNTFLGNNYSIGPFEYKIWRPKTNWSSKHLELFLYTRERLLSFIEKVFLLEFYKKSGTYHDFQADSHLSFILNNKDIYDSLGVLNNLLISEISGFMDGSPYENSYDCLGLLDRRFWLYDETLEQERPHTLYSSQEISGGGSYSDLDGPYLGLPNVKPLFLEYLNAILKDEDLLYQWRKYYIDLILNKQYGSSVVKPQFTVRTIPT